MRDLLQDKARVWEHLTRLAQGGDVARAYAPDAMAEIAFPYDTATGAQIAGFYADLTRALPDAEWRPEIFIAGDNHPDTRTTDRRFSPLVGSFGHWQGTFTEPLLGIQPTGGVVHLRMCEVHHLDSAGKISRAWILPDFLDLMDQAGQFPLPPMNGARGMWPGPRGGGGVRMGSVDEIGGAASMAQVLDMHNALNTHVGPDVSGLTMAHWDPNFMYYAAAGIGICRGVEGFRRNHQIPFREAVPDRHSRGHFVRIADGPFALTGGRLYATHTGPYLGMPATGRQVHIDVMDFYHFDADGLICENWLPFDVLRTANQMGVNLLPQDGG
ncbi:ester cyclase [Gymnodinialimonas ceratoperidinii]|uniref:Ester cyclase n=1 Tax=Gymnodinialimonas ceratoperidinii TaxID=2856823 RepID=A0A8F6TUJ7_9RHOB|nr:ester cyclase [Gymnodinialimonas ceratoperidinii]QXT38129.1 ester cyclase [Gymnodinialimonas ceratoperidinii]